MPPLTAIVSAAPVHVTAASVTWGPQAKCHWRRRVPLQWHFLHRPTPLATVRHGSLALPGSVCLHASPLRRSRSHTMLPRSTDTVSARARMHAFLGAAAPTAERARSAARRCAAMETAAHSDVRVGMISTYPLQACGIGTFAHDLVQGLHGIPRPVRTVVAAINGVHEHYGYDPLVHMQIEELDRASYLAAGYQLNRMPIVDVVSIQHNFGNRPFGSIEQRGGRVSLRWVHLLELETVAFVLRIVPHAAFITLEWKPGDCLLFRRECAEEGACRVDDAPATGRCGRKVGEGRRHGVVSCIRCGSLWRDSTRRVWRNASTERVEHGLRHQHITLASWTTVPECWSPGARVGAPRRSPGPGADATRRGRW